MNEDIEKLIITEDSTKEYIERRNNERLEVLDEAKKTKDYIVSTTSKLETMVEHMLKYQYNINIQTRSWINTIYRDYDETTEAVEKSTTNLINDIDKDMVKIYNNGRNKMLKRNLSVDPLTVPIDNIGSDNKQIFTLDNLTNKKWVEDYLVKYAQSNEAKKELSKRGLL